MLIYLLQPVWGGLTVLEFTPTPTRLQIHNDIIRKYNQTVIRGYRGDIWESILGLSIMGSYVVILFASYLLHKHLIVLSCILLITPWISWGEMFSIPPQFSTESESLQNLESISPPKQESNLALELFWFSTSPWNLLKVLNCVRWNSFRVSYKFIVGQTFIELFPILLWNNSLFKSFSLYYHSSLLVEGCTDCTDLLKESYGIDFRFIF
jgi:hypothetical protein